MTFTVRPLPCNYCVSALCLHGTYLTHLHACVKAKGSYFEHNLPRSPQLTLINMHMLCVCTFEALLCLLQTVFYFNQVPDMR